MLFALGALASSHVTLCALVGAFCLGILVFGLITHIVVLCLGQKSMVLQGLLVMGHHVLPFLSEILVGFLCGTEGLLQGIVPKLWPLWSSGWIGLRSIH